MTRAYMEIELKVPSGSSLVTDTALAKLYLLKCAY